MKFCPFCGITLLVLNPVFCHECGKRLSSSSSSSQKPPQPMSDMPKAPSAPTLTAFSMGTPPPFSAVHGSSVTSMPKPPRKSLPRPTSGSSGSSSEPDDPPLVPIGTCKAKYDFVGREDEDEISFKAGEKVFVLDYRQVDWCSGINEQGKVGQFPSNYVSEMTPVKRARAKFDYKETEDNEISLVEGKIYHVLSEEEDGWWIGVDVTSGRKPDGTGGAITIGTFPSNYVSLLD